MAAHSGNLPVLRKIALFIFLSIFTNSVCAANKDAFSEELFVKPLSSGHVMFHFQFTTIWNVSIIDSAESPFQHYRLFPKSLGDVLSTYSVRELHLSQTQGLWKHDKWGYAPEDAPPGAELWVWFQHQTKNVDKTWSELVNALSGLFCSSLNFIDEKSTVRPRWSFRPAGLAPERYSNDFRFLRYSALPREIVCTENLTPWKKLLPCDSKVGLATLFNAVRLYDASFHSLGLHVRPVCQDSECTTSATELKQTLTVVFDPTTSRNGRQDWSLSSMFGNSLKTSCPLASRSKIYVDITSQEKTLTLRPNTYSEQIVTRGGDSRKYAVYDVAQEMARGSLNVQAEYSEAFTFGNSILPPVHASRYITGYGLERGGVVCQIHNNLDQNLTVIYMETVPWFLRLYFNSLKIQNNGKEIKPYKIHYIPGRDRSRPYQIEIVFRLRAESVTTITYSFERAFLKWTEYPPDANHGFYVNSAVISTVLPTASNFTATQQQATSFEESMSDTSSSFFLRFHTESLLVSLPTPDFSMPYNVICLACTVVAIAFGSVHNLTTRAFKVIDPEKDKQRGILARIFKRKSGVSVSKSTDDEGEGPEDKQKTEDKNDQETDNVNEKTVIPGEGS